MVDAARVDVLNAKLSTWMDSLRYWLVGVVVAVLVGFGGIIAASVVRC